MRTRILRVDEGPERFVPLLAALAEAGMRCGWLDLETPADPPAELETAAGHGVLRAVSAVGDRVVVVKPVRGGPVPRDLLREHFRGCALVLARGEVEAARLAADGEGWEVRTTDGATRLTTDELVANLRKPRWLSSFRPRS